MKERIIEKKKRKTCIVDFTSIEEFYKYICNTPINESFRWERLNSTEGTEKFTGTKSFEEATELLKNGSEYIAKKINQKLKTEKFDVDTKDVIKNIYDVQGFQCCVPLYLQGVPTNMIAKKNIKVKQKVITLTKNSAYSCFITTEKIIEESVKALQIAKKIESQGVRCNINICIGTSSRTGTDELIKIRIKNANEKMNISKTAFCMAHPSMLRRLVLRFIEVYPYSDKGFVTGYGKPVKAEEIKKIEGFLDKNEYLIPEFITKDVTSINDLETLA